ncbi:hypothetical protein HAX54_042251, partial [Datura stramonium]|nr:hypothetical protein [Datura stramonium]
ADCVERGGSWIEEGKAGVAATGCRAQVAAPGERVRGAWVPVKYCEGKRKGRWSTESRAGGWRVVVGKREKRGTTSGWG